MTSLLALGSYSCGGEDSQDPGWSTTTFRAPGISAQVPDGWTATRRPLSLSDPLPLLTAASYELDSVPKNGSCYPVGALARKPAGGALVVVTRYGLDGQRFLRKLSRRPDSFALGPRSYGNFDCGGRKYNLNFREGSRGFKIDVWLERPAAGPQVLPETVDLLNSLELGRTE